MTQQERQRERPDILFCELKYRLIGDFVAANHELMELQNQQTQAVIDHDPDFSRFETLTRRLRICECTLHIHPRWNRRPTAIRCCISAAITRTSHSQSLSAWTPT